MTPFWAAALGVGAVWLTGLATMITTALLVARILDRRLGATCQCRHTKHGGDR